MRFPQQILKITGVQVLPRSTQETSEGAEKYVPGCEAGRVSGGCAAVDGCSPSRRLSRTHLRIAPPTGKAAGIFTITPGVLIPQHFKHRMLTGPEKTFKYNQVLEAGGHWCDMQSVHSSYRRPPGVTSRVGQGMLQEALRAPALVPRTHTFKPFSSHMFLVSILTRFHLDSTGSPTGALGQAPAVVWGRMRPNMYQVPATGPVLYKYHLLVALRTAL